jgi:hypothetical protein
VWTEHRPKGRQKVRILWPSEELRIIVGASPVKVFQHGDVL